MPGPPGRCLRLWQRLDRSPHNPEPLGSHASARLTVHGSSLIVKRHRQGWTQAHVPAVGMGVSRKCMRQWLHGFCPEGGVDRGWPVVTSGPYQDPIRRRGQGRGPPSGRVARADSVTPEVGVPRPTMPGPTAGNQRPGRAAPGQDGDHSQRTRGIPKAAFDSSLRHQFLRRALRAAGRGVLIRGLSASLSHTTPPIISASQMPLAGVSTSSKKTGPRRAAPTEPMPAQAA